jgi:protoporphyrinogen oxidase
MRVLGVLFLLSSTLLADVVVLKDGTRVSGKVVDKQKHWEITTDGGLRTYLKEEVEKIIKDPKELLGDVEKVMAEAKDEYQKAVAMPEGAERNALLKDSIAKIDAARAAVSSTRELFPRTSTPTSTRSSCRSCSSSACCATGCTPSSPAGSAARGSARPPPRPRPR